MFESWFKKILKLWLHITLTFPFYRTTIKLYSLILFDRRLMSFKITFSPLCLSYVNCSTHTEIESRQTRKPAIADSSRFELFFSAPAEVDCELVQGNIRRIKGYRTYTCLRVNVEKTNTRGICHSPGARNSSNYLRASYARLTTTYTCIHLRLVYPKHGETGS